MSIFSDIAAGFKKVFGFLSTPKVESVIRSAASLALQAAPVVQEIALLIPNKTFQEVVDAYTKFGVPFAQEATSDPTQIGNYMLNLGTAQLSKALSAQKATAATSLLQTAVQIAVLALKTA